MNERILELAKQAGLKKGHVSDREYIGDFDWREFAELIVRECCDMFVELRNRPADLAVKDVQKFFGVKE